MPQPPIRGPKSCGHRDIEVAAQQQFFESRRLSFRKCKLDPRMQGAEACEEWRQADRPALAPASALHASERANSPRTARLPSRSSASRTTPKNTGSDRAPSDPPILTDLPVRCPWPPKRSHSLAYRHRSYAHSGLNQIGPNSTNLEQLRAWSGRLLSIPTPGKSDAIDRRDRGVDTACYATAIELYAERVLRT